MYANVKKVDPFILDLFFDNESVSTVSKIVTDVVITLKEENAVAHEYLDAIHNSAAKEVDFFEHTIKRYTDRQYKEIFKVSRDTMKELIDYLKDKCNADLQRMVVAFEKKVHILLYILSSTESFHNISKVVNTSKSSLCVIFHEMCTLVTECRFDWIKWPSLEEQSVIRKKIKTFPNCVGLLDTCQFKAKTPGKNPVNNHISTKPEYNIILQAVCDHTLKFTDIYVEDKVEKSDAVVFENSPLCEDLENLISSENHILASQNYPLKVNLMTPFHRSSLTSNKKYNKAHSSARVHIRRALGRLKARFRRLTFLDVKNTETAMSIICAACVLHNFIIAHEPDEDESDDQEVSSFNIQCDGVSAEDKRDLLNYYIYSKF